MAVVARSWCRFAKMKEVSRALGKFHMSTSVTKRDRLIDRMKKFVLGEGAPPEEKETVERLVRRS